ncbi:MAG: vWA domain-containing protein [Bacteroidota bacterium]
MRTIRMLFLCLGLCCNQPACAGANVGADSKEYKIQIALLLDVSGSMNGLIAQAKSRIWRMINELNRFTKNGEKPLVEMAIGIVGNPGYELTGYCNLLTPLTTDMEQISEALLMIEVGGEFEYFPYALKLTIDSLSWSEEKEDLRIIFIAGNETFDQGAVSTKDAIKLAVKRNIYVNTIFCGSETNKVCELWKTIAKECNGEFCAINQDSVKTMEETIWDKKITDFNNKLNSTYLPFGLQGKKGAENQLKQDNIAELLGNSFFRERVIYKSSPAYDCSDWDLVDAYAKDPALFSKLDTSLIPVNMRMMSIPEREKYILQIRTKRDLYKEGVKTYYEKAQEVLLANTGKTDKNISLDNSIILIVKKLAAKQGYAFR